MEQSTQLITKKSSIFMWLTNSSVGRKVVMSVTGLFLVLFVTFHALMNAVALISFEAYDAICEFLGANWYAVLGTLILAGGFAIHIIYAFWLTLQNRKARGNNRYAVTTRPKDVEWASQNMLVLGIIVLCFMVLHLTQFWAKMQLPELMGEHIMRGQDYLRATFSQLWVLPVYLIWFAALWFHICHGFWSAFQTLGTANDKWIPRWQCISKWWATIVFILFAVEACYFTWFFAL
jgi:succinate dehydrogenase / fumarate reductase cytochrome b subunit